MITIFPDSVNYTFTESLTPSAACPIYATYANGSAQSAYYKTLYQQQIADRLNTFIDGNLTIVPSDVGTMQDLCGYGYVINGDKRFCDLFTGAFTFFSFGCDVL